MKVLKQDYPIYVFIILSSFLLSAFISTHDNLINRDGICYLLSAESMTNSSIQTAMHICSQALWPFYSWLIFAFSKIMMLSYVTAAYVLNALFSAMSAIFFLVILKELSTSKRILWLGAIVFLLAHDFNAVRQYIVRDHGFWAFYLASLYFLIQYFKNFNLRFAVLWFASLLLATLFRVEGIFFLALLPFSIFFLKIPRLQQWQHFLKLFSPLVVLVGIVLLRMNGVLERYHDVEITAAKLLNNFTSAKLVLSNAVLNSFAVHQVTLILTLALMVAYLIKIASNLSWIYSALTIFAIKKNLVRFNRVTLVVILSYITINILVTATFFLREFFLAKRYVIALNLILMLWVPFALDYLILQFTQHRKRAVLAFAILLILISGIGGIYTFGTSKTYIRNAGLWLANNVPMNAKLYANDYQLLYYSQHFGLNLQETANTYKSLNSVDPNFWKQYDYLAVSSTRNNEVTTTLQTNGKKPLLSFNNKSGDRVDIYKIREEKSQ